MSGFATLRAREPRLAWAGAASLAVLLLCLAALPFDARTLAGAPVWAKPAKFAAGFVLWFWTLAWLWPALSPTQRAGRFARGAVWAMLAAAALELGWIAWRAAAGGSSHFAEDALGQAMYALMGLGATLLVGLLAALGAMILWGGAPDMPRARREAAGLGLLLGGVLGGAAGWAISLNGGPWIGGPGTNAGGWPLLLWSREVGDLRAAHFLGMHAMQALPLLAALGAGLGWVRAGAAGWTALTLLAFGLALAGRPLA